MTSMCFDNSIGVEVKEGQGWEKLLLVKHMTVLVNGESLI